MMASMTLKIWLTTTIAMGVAVAGGFEDGPTGPASLYPDGCLWTATSKPALVCAGANLTVVPRLNVTTNFVDFSGNALTALSPPTLAPFRTAGAALETLVLKACRIRSLEAGAFDQLLNLRIVDLSNNSIAVLEARVFASLDRLAELDLSANEIASVDAGWLVGASGLRVLNMDANPLGRLNASVFIHSTALEELTLSGCALRSVDERAFDGLFKLRTLDLSANQLVTLTPDTMTWMCKLRHLRLDANPWRCDCDVQAVTVILLMRGFRALVANATCALPDRSDGSSGHRVNWADVDDARRECQPRVHMHARKTTLMSGSACGLADKTSSRPPLVDTPRLVSSRLTGATGAYAAVVTAFVWCAVILVSVVASYLGVYLAGKMCVCATTKAAAAAGHVVSGGGRAGSGVAGGGGGSRKKKASIVRRESGSECERALVEETSQFRDNFYLVDEASSDISVSLDV